MAILSAWQRINRVIANRPWGDGVNGSVTISSDPNTRATFTGSATQTTGTAGTTAFANGDLVVCHQTQGTGAGKWEINMVASGGGTTSLTMKQANYYTYAAGAQIIKVPRYTTATVNTHSVTAWNRTTGGVEVICAKTSITVASANTLVGNGLGYNKGLGGCDGSGKGGEGYNGIHENNQATNDNAGRASNASPGAAGGNGTVGTRSGTQGNDGTFGLIAGVADLTAIVFGGGGGGAEENGYPNAHGGRGAAIFILISKSIVISGAIANNGEAGVNSPARGGGGAAGGSVLAVCGTITLGSNLITATGGAGGAGSQAQNMGGTGGVGRIAVHHSGAITGTTNPTFTNVTDATLVELVSSGFFNFF